VSLLGLEMTMATIAICWEALKQKLRFFLRDVDKNIEFDFPVPSPRTVVHMRTARKRPDFVAPGDPKRGVQLVGCRVAKPIFSEEVSTTGAHEQEDNCD
jgi:hypothetical protein